MQNQLSGEELLRHYVGGINMLLKVKKKVIGEIDFGKQETTA